MGSVQSIMSGHCGEPLSTSAFPKYRTVAFFSVGLSGTGVQLVPLGICLWISSSDYPIPRLLSLQHFTSRFIASF